VSVPDLLTGEGVQQARHMLGLTQAAFAQVLQSTPRNVRKWEAGEVTPSGPARVAIRLLLERRRCEIEGSLR